MVSLAQRLPSPSPPPPPVIRPAAHPSLQRPLPALQDSTPIQPSLTRRQALLQLLCLLRVVQDQGVEVARAPDLELCHGLGLGGGLGLGRGGGGGGRVLQRGLLDAGDWIACQPESSSLSRLRSTGLTRRILPPRHLEELLDVLDLLRLESQRDRPVQGRVKRGNREKVAVRSDSNPVRCPASPLPPRLRPVCWLAQ